MVARIQGFPDSWTFCGRKTAAYRQVGNAFPPPVAAALGNSIRDALAGGTTAGTQPAQAGAAAAVSGRRLAGKPATSTGATPAAIPASSVIKRAVIAPHAWQAARKLRPA